MAKDKSPKREQKKPKKDKSKAPDVSKMLPKLPSDDLKSAKLKYKVDKDD